MDEGEDGTEGGTFDGPPGLCVDFVFVVGGGEGDICVYITRGLSFCVVVVVFVWCWVVVGGGE